jgi:hypothetical protein
VQSQRLRQEDRHLAARQAAIRAVVPSAASTGDSGGRERSMYWKNGCDAGTPPNVGDAGAGLN